MWDTGAITASPKKVSANKSIIVGCRNVASRNQRAALVTFQHQVKVDLDLMIRKNRLNLQTSTVLQMSVGQILG